MFLGIPNDHPGSRRGDIERAIASELSLETSGSLIQIRDLVHQSGN